MSQDVIESIRRRQLLKSAGASALIAGLAGCSGSDDPATTTGDETTDDSDGESNTDTSDEESSGGEPMDSVFTNRITPDLSRKQIGFNEFDPDSKSIQVQSTMAELLMGLDTKNNEFLPRIVESAEIDGTTMTATVSDEYGWSDGTPITAKDLETHFTLQIAHDYSVTNFVEEVTAVDEKTVEFALTAEANPEILKQQVLVSQLNYGHDVFGEYAQKFKEASSDEEIEAVQKELQELPIKLDENIDQLVTTGPVAFSSENNKRIVMEPNEHHPNGDAINFDGVEFLWAKDQSALQSMLKSDRLDTLSGKLSNSYLGSLPDHHEVWTHPQQGGNSIDFYLQDDLYGDMRVRQAFNYIIDQNLMARASDYASEPVKYFAGTPDYIAENYIPEDKLSQFSTYEPDHEKAASLLEDAGFSQDGDTWLTPDGETWKPKIGIASGSSDRVKEISVAVEQFSDFGVEAEMNIQESSTYWASIRERDYKIGTYAWGDRGNRHPWFDYDYMWIGRAFNDQDEAWNGLTNEVEVPGTVGDPDSALETWNISELTTELGKTSDESRQTELITKLGWMYNQYLPKLPVNHSTVSTVMTRDHWEFPPKEEVANSRAGDGSQPLLREGLLQAKTE